MIKAFMRSPLPNALAVVVLIALIVTWIASLVITLRERPLESRRGWYAVLLPLFSLLGLPAAIDLLFAQGVALLYAPLVLLAFAANIVVPVLGRRASSSNALTRDWYRWSVLLSALAGLGVAAYLTLVDTTGGQVSCGPSGGCVTVQRSKYAVVLDLMPVATLGLIGYIAILAAWIAWQFGGGALQRWAPVALWGMAMFGTLFSIYLTFLEPFVIGATCMWCISSAVLMIILLLDSTPAAKEALALPEE